MALFLPLVIAAITLGITGAVVKGLLCLLITGVVVLSPTPSSPVCGSAASAGAQAGEARPAGSPEAAQYLTEDHGRIARA